jgi:hypothetical protein
MNKLFWMTASVLCLSLTVAAETVQWKHLSTATGDLPLPGTGRQQTAGAVCDIDKDGINDFVVAERTEAPAVVWFRKTAGGWDRYIIEKDKLRIEAGSDTCDVDGDGDMDVAFGGDYATNEVWWWENPCPDFDPEKGWKRHVIKNIGSAKHHDLIFGDFNGDGKEEIVLWNQGGQKLYYAEIPKNVRRAKSWNCVEIYSYSDDSEMLQRQTRPYPGFKGINEHEGLAKADIDGDGKLDIIGGGRWFKHIKGTMFSENIIDASYAFSRSAVGQLIEGGRPEVVFVVGDGWAPLVMYEWKPKNEKVTNQGTWRPTELVPEIDNGHSLAIVDFNRDGHLDIWVAEMRLGENSDAKNMILLGDGKGHFETQIINEGFGNHESKIADLDGDGDYDILGKPYIWETPRLDIWINQVK